MLAAARSVVLMMERTVQGLALAAAWAAALVLVGVIGHILVEIVLRAIFSSSTFVLDEFVGYGVAAATFLALPHALERGTLIRVNLLLAPLSDDGLIRRLIELLCILSTLWVVGFVIRYFWRSVSRNWGRGTVSSSVAEVPLWIPEGLMLLGLAIFWLHLVVYLLRIGTGQLPIGTDSGSKA
jgi:TRAP-type C4-dicarboxylate transport system permease small subunit